MVAVVGQATVAIESKEKNDTTNTREGIINNERPQRLWQEKLNCGTSSSGGIR